MNGHLSRRRVLNGMMHGAAISVGLPFLNCFLNQSGTALASGEPLPARFGTWFWGCGTAAPAFRQEKSGAGYELMADTEELEPIRKEINLFGRFDVVVAGKPTLCHHTGMVGVRCGEIPDIASDYPRESLDVSIADVIGNATRFRSIDLAATGNVRTSVSFRSADAINPAETSATMLYQRVFGPEFQNPNSPTFTPDPKIMVRKSVLSAVRDDGASLTRYLGTEDRARLDQYFTAIRQAEQRLQQQLQKPPPAEACRVPTPPPPDPEPGLNYELVKQRHDTMTDILILALACNQTRVFNLAYSDGLANTVNPGFEKTHHTTTHEEPIDEKLGYQVQHAWFVRQALQRFVYLVKAMASVKEGDGTLLDRSLVFAHSDHEVARLHSYPNIPMMTAGRAGGRMKVGRYVNGKNTPCTRVGLTLQRLMGLTVSEWGKGPMRTSDEVSEILV